jgi:hypothetical protein
MVIPSSEDDSTFAGLVQCCISHRAPDAAISIEVYADLLKVKRLGQFAPVGGKRGKVRGFSSASRKRFLESMAKSRCAANGAFVTLTYPGQFSQDPKRWKRDLDVVLKRLKRIQPSICGFWRLEFQKRGAPHFHIILFGRTTNIARLRQWFKLAWYQVVESGDERHLRVGVRVDLINSRRHAMAYASKYAAKIADDEIEAGRLWGQFGDLDQEPVAVGRASFQQFIQIRRAVVRWLKSRGSRFARALARRATNAGFTIFGLGDLSRQEWTNPFESTVLRLLYYA